MNRRGFFKNSAVAMGSLTLASKTSQRSMASQRDPFKRRHLINIMVFGGWDQFWHQGAVPISEMSGILESQGRIVDAGGAFVSTSGSGASILANSATSLTTPVGSGKFHARFPDAYLRKHPQMGGSYFLGPGMSDFTQTDLGRMLIWRGIQSEGGHYIGNRIMQTGTTGDQTGCFSSVIADHLGDDYVRDLHYAQLSNSSSAMYNQPVNKPGAGQPINIPSLQEWTALTTPNAQDLPSSRRQYLDAALATLSGPSVSSRFAVKASQGIWANFLNAFNGAEGLSSTGYASSAQFLALWAAYNTALQNALQGSVFWIWFSNQQSFVTSMLGPQNAATAGAGVFLGDLTFRFAMAEFLIANDLSAVVDMPGLDLDYHQYVDRECFLMLAHMTCFRTLVSHLAATPVPGTTRSLLDVTTVIMHTEFVRDMILAPNTLATTEPGTGHWDYQTSIFMAGMGVQGGKIVGDFKRGPNSAVYTDVNFPQAIYRSLPIDTSATGGQPTSSGEIVTSRSIFPTMLSIFGASGLNPITGGGANAIAAVMKSTGF